MKKLDQSVFVDAPEWAEWAVVNKAGGFVEFWPRRPTLHIHRGEYDLDAQNDYIDGDFYIKDWPNNSIIQRERGS